jgi:hypothetical protein
MSKRRDDKGRFLKQNPPKTNQPSVGAGTSTTKKNESIIPTAGKITLEELEEKKHSGQRLTLIERQILLTHEVKKKQTKSETSYVGKQKEEKQPILEQIGQPIFSNRNI